ncbi:hypothetical protein [Nocardioides montaniterrae]
MSDPVVPPSAPLPLLGAAAIAALEGVAMIIGAVITVATVEKGHGEIAAGIAVAFTAYGVLMIAGGVGLVRLRTWARGPVLFSQLVVLLTAWGSRHVPLAAVALAIAGVAAIACLVHPASIAAIEGSRDQDSASND